MSQCVLNILVFIYEGQSWMERLEKLCTVMSAWLICCQAGGAENNPKATPESASFLCHPGSCVSLGDTAWPGALPSCARCAHPNAASVPSCQGWELRAGSGGIIRSQLLFFLCPVSGFYWLVLLYDVENPVACYSDLNCVIQQCGISLGDTSGGCRVAMLQSWALAVHQSCHVSLRTSCGGGKNELGWKQGGCLGFCRCRWMCRFWLG